MKRNQRNAILLAVICSIFLIQVFAEQPEFDEDDDGVTIESEKLVSISSHKCKKKIFIKLFPHCRIIQNQHTKY